MIMYYIVINKLNKGDFQMVDIKIKQLKCKKCEYEWTPRKTPVYQCPKCHSCKWYEGEGKDEA